MTNEQDKQDQILRQIKSLGQSVDILCFLIVLAIVSLFLTR